MSNWTWGKSEKSASSGKVNGSYLFVASIILKEDYILPADGTGTPHTETIGRFPLSRLMGLLTTALLTGYVPLYTKTVATAESCVKLFGMNLCSKKDATVWCGVLGGNCLAQMKMAGMTLWVPGLCAMTRTVCRMGENGEAEMKALVTAKHLDVGTSPSPCLPHTGLPASMNCPVASAPGINATGHQVSVAGFVDGPRPDIADLDEGESMINHATNLAIAFGVLGCLCSGSVTAFFLWRRKKTLGLNQSAVAVSSPSILTSQPQWFQKGAVVCTVK